MRKKVRIMMDLTHDPTGCSYYIEFIPTEISDFDTIKTIMEDFKKVCKLHDFQVIEINK